MWMCNDGWLQGWYRAQWRNPRLYRMKEEEVAQCRLFFDPQPREWVNMGVQADNLAGEHFITTGSGKFFRNVEPDPVHSIGIVEINDKGDSWRIVWGPEMSKAHIRVPAHFMNQRPQPPPMAQTVIYHCHATNVIVSDLHPAPRPTGTSPKCCGRAPPSVRENSRRAGVARDGDFGVISPATSELMKTYQAAIRHSTVCLPPARTLTSPLVWPTPSKRVPKFTSRCSPWAAVTIRQTITDDDLRAIARDFGVTPNEKFLN